MSDLKPSTEGAGASRPLSPSAPQLLSGETFIPATVVAELMGISRRGAAKRCMAEGWEHRYVSGEGGGRRLEVGVASLPPEVQVRAAARLESTVRGPRSEATDVAPAGTEYERASAKDRAEADRRLALLTAWGQFVGQSQEPRVESRDRTERTREFVRVSREQGQRVSKASLYAWDAAYRARGLDGLLPRYRGGRDTTLSEDDRRLFLACWGNEARPKVTRAYRDLLIIRAERRLPGPPPTLHAIRYMLAQLTDEERDALRKGDAAYAQAHLPFMERDFDIAPLEWFCMDDRQFDVITISRVTGKPHRPYVCAGEDLGTRRVVVSVGDRPCQDSTLATSAKALAAWGVFANLYADNGKNYKAKSVTGKWGKPFTRGLNEGRCRSLCDQLGITPHFAIKFNARAKPVERFFATVAENLDKIFSGYTGRSTDQKPEGLREEISAGRLATDDEFERVLTGWIEAEYHQTMPHHGEGMKGRTPNQAWAEGIGQVQVRKPTREQLKFWLCRAPVATVRNGRIKLFGNRRYHPAMENLDCLHGWDGREVVARYDPQDVTRLFVTDLEDNPIGWLIEKSLLGFGEVSGRRVDEARARQRRANALKRAHREEVRAGQNEPDMLKRIVREHYARQAATDEQGNPTPTPPPGKPKIVELMPASEGARASARLVATPPAEDARLHAVRARIAEEEAESIAPGAGRRERKPSRAELSDEAIEMLGRRVESREPRAATGE
ncbi:MAG: Mu transposase C-terminal domain-containing protein [Candidatus Rokubacteria bacterium]|nr:Mu transposase C-terminal domain-containing protein [Candidatus Rokubacteria bacterium]